MVGEKAISKRADLSRLLCELLCDLCGQGSEQREERNENAFGWLKDETGSHRDVESRQVA
jgi:hypothetical protein